MRWGKERKTHFDLSNTNLEKAVKETLTKSKIRHSREGGNPERPTNWTPAFADVTAEIAIPLGLVTGIGARRIGLFYSEWRKHRGR